MVNLLSLFFKTFTLASLLSQTMEASIVRHLMTTSYQLKPYLSKLQATHANTTTLASWTRASEFFSTPSYLLARLTLWSAWPMTARYISFPKRCLTPWPGHRGSWAQMVAYWLTLFLITSPWCLTRTRTATWMSPYLYKYLWSPTRILLQPLSLTESPNLWACKHLRPLPCSSNNSYSRRELAALSFSRWSARTRPRWSSRQQDSLSCLSQYCISSPTTCNRSCSKK